MTAPSSARRPFRRVIAAPAAVALTLSVLAAGCASQDDQPTDSSSANASNSSEPSGSSDSGTGSTETETKAVEGAQVEITFKGDTVTPNGERMDVELGETLTLTVTADAPGEMHVHSTPEQSIDYPKGSSTHRLTFDQPGLVEVESHNLDKVILQLEVR